MSVSRFRFFNKNKNTPSAAAAHIVPHGQKTSHIEDIKSLDDYLESLSLSVIKLILDGHSQDGHAKDNKQNFFQEVADLIHLLQSNKALSSLIKNNEHIKNLIKYLVSHNSLKSYKYEMNSQLDARMRSLWTVWLTEIPDIYPKSRLVLYLTLFLVVCVRTLSFSGSLLLAKDDQEKNKIRQDLRIKSATDYLLLIGPYLAMLSLAAIAGLISVVSRSRVNNFGTADLLQINQLAKQIRNAINKTSVADLDKPGYEAYMRNLVFNAKANQPIQPFVPENQPQPGLMG
jgi:hypothetical protein